MVLLSRQLCLQFALICVAASALSAADRDRIQPWTVNPSYWQYKSSPVLLLGGSDDDNLFQWPGERLRPQLDLLKRAGGNYLRNTMSDRHDGNWELYPFEKLPNAKYDLNRWNDDYWDRFDQFLRWTAERDIIVQIEVWDRFDYSRNHWPPHPYNPANNVNFTYEESGLASEYPDHPGQNKQPFFFTTPAQRNNTVLLKYQQRFVDKMLSYSLKYGHVLYCMDNETSGDEEWSRYWAHYIKSAAKKAGVAIYVTEMWDDWDLKAPRHRRTFDHPELYDFVDISQNNHNSGAKHWANALWVRQYVSAHSRPINTVKTYGATGNRFGHSDQDGIERFWRHILAGLASARFHRPDSGQGLNERAQAAMRSVRMMETLVKAWELSPDTPSITALEGTEIYTAAAPDKAWVAYFPKGGAARLAAAPGDYTVRWIDVDAGTRGPAAPVTNASTIRLSAPGQSNQVAVVLRGRSDGGP
jgi:hypothetical protein